MWIKRLGFGIPTIASFLVGCGEAPVERADLRPCPTDGAAIAVHANLLQIVCGCAEPQGTMSVPGAPMTCTVDVGDTVLFIFAADKIKQQLIADGTPAIPPSGVYDTRDPNRALAHAFRVPASGTYRYRDVFNPEVVGEIVAP